MPSRLCRGTDPVSAVAIDYRARVFSVRRTLTLLAVLLGLAKLCACSVALDTRIAQCQSNEDCARFGDSTCDLDQQLCVPRAIPPRNDASAAASSVGSDAVSACAGKNGCFACAPKLDPEFFNACTDSRCLPFDNRRLHNLTPDGLLKPLP